jgi:hypothetical protein
VSADARNRNVLQHGVGEWIGKANFADLPGHLSARAEAMRSRLYEMAGQKYGDVGFSHDD